MQNLQDIPDRRSIIYSKLPVLGRSSFLHENITTATYFLHVRQATMTSQATMADVNRAAELLIPTILTTIVAFIMTALRIYVRLRVIKLLDWDDFFNVLAMVSFNDAYKVSSQREEKANGLSEEEVNLYSDYRLLPSW